MPDASRLIVAACWLRLSTAGSALLAVGVAEAGVAFAAALAAFGSNLGRDSSADFSGVTKMSPFEFAAELGLGARQRVGPALPARPAGAGGVVALAELQRGGTVHVALAVDRHRLLDLAGGRIGVEAYVGVGTERVAHVIEVLQLAWRGRIGDRKEAAVARAHADGLGAGVRLVRIGVERLLLDRGGVRIQRSGVDVVVGAAAKQSGEQIAGLLRTGALRIVTRDQLVAAAAYARLQFSQIAPHAADLRVDLAALGRRGGAKEQELPAVTADRMRVSDGSVELLALPRGGGLILSVLSALRRVRRFAGEAACIQGFAALVRRSGA